MNKPDTRHLDTALSILGAGRTAKPRSKTTVINLYGYGADGVSVQVNGKEVWLAPHWGAAREDANRRAAHLRTLGRTVRIQED